MDNQEQIVAYLQGTLSSQEKKDFESALKRDPMLAQQTDEMRDLLKGIELYGEERLRNQLRSITDGAPRMNVWNRGRTLKVAAAVLILLAAAVWWWVPDHSEPSIVEQPAVPSPSFEPAPPPPANTEKMAPSGPSSPQKNTSTQRAGAMLALANSRYQSPGFTQLRSGGADSAALLMNRRAWRDAIAWINKHPASGDGRIAQEVMLAHAWMSQHRYDIARPLLENVVKSDALPWSEESQYYLLLCYVARWESDSAKYLRQSAQWLKQKEHPDFDRIQTLDAAVKKQLNSSLQGGQ